MLNTIQTLDFQILDAIQNTLRCAFLDRLMPAVSALGNYGILWIAIALLFLIWKKRRACGAHLAAGLIGGVLIGNVLLKHLVARPRPCWINSGIELLINNPTDYSFPSGHTLAATIAAAILFHSDRLLGIPAVILAAMIAFSRLYLYVHFPSDVIAAVALGLFIAFAVIRLAAAYRGKCGTTQRSCA